MLAPIAVIPTLDLKTAQARCNRNILTSVQIYEVLKSLGIEYGAGYRGIETVQAGTGEILAKLSLPSAVSDTGGRFVLHPGLLDAALQATICFTIASGGLKTPRSIAMRELEIFGKYTPVMWALIRADEEDKAGYDIDLCDEQGMIRVRMKGYSTGIREAEPTPEKSVASLKKMLLKAEWQEQAVLNEVPASDYTQHLVILGEMGDNCAPEAVLENMGAGMNGLRCFALQSGRKGIAQRYLDYVIRIFDEVKNFHSDQPEEKVLIQIVIPNQGEGQLLAGLLGLLKTARLENPQLTWQLLEVEPGENIEGIAAKLKENRRYSGSVQARYQGGKRLIAGWSEIETAWEEPAGGATIPWKDGGIYLITGGAGGLGLIFAGEIASKVRNAVLILTGRSPLTEDKQARIGELEAGNVKIIYKQADVADKKTVNNLIQSIKVDFGGLNGIIHCAGVLRDGLIVKKTRGELEEVLAPKVSGLINLDAASRELSLDFLILFSSRAGIVGNQGQADYSAANAFMDAYAGYRNRLVALNQRRGRTLAINWPQWQEGGMQPGTEIEKLWESMGMVIMDTRTGIRALYQGLVSGGDQVTVLVEDLRRIQSILGNQAGGEALKINSAGLRGRGRRPEMKGLSSEQCLEWDLKQFINRLLKIPREKIDRRKNLAEFGFNSISLTQLAIQLIKYFGIAEITPALFFRYSSLEKLVRYFLTQYQSVIEDFYREDAIASARLEPDITTVTAPAPAILRRKTPGRARFITGDTSLNVSEPVAIIGMSGRFPGARNIDELWTILAAGRDMVREIPPERFDWRQYYGDPAEPGKTNCKWCGCLPGVSEFEPLFFEISPKEAETMDPRQRLLLQESWKALEDAGYGSGQLKTEKIGMFVGVEQGEYQLLAKGEGSITANNNAILAARLAYFLNLSGPVMAIDTACSSGLVAAHQAVLSLHNNECSTVIAASVCLMLTPSSFIGLSRAGMLSDEGKCYTFDRRANGMVPGEAVTAVVLKRLSRAEADGDPIYAVIRGSGINYDGKTNGITAPSGLSQANLLKAVYDQYRVNPEEIEYIVTHGTGTKLGDPVEINALDDAFKAYTCTLVCRARVRYSRARQNKVIARSPPPRPISAIRWPLLGWSA